MSMESIIEDFSEDDLCKLRDMCIDKIQSLKNTRILRNITDDCKENGYYIVFPHEKSSLSMIDDTLMLAQYCGYVKVTTWDKEDKSDPKICDSASTQDDWVQELFEGCNIIDDIIHDTNNIDFTITSDWDYRDWDDPIYAPAEIDISIVFNRTTLKYSITSPQSDDDKSFIILNDKGNKDGWSVHNTQIMHNDQFKMSIDQWGDLGIIENYMGLGVNLIRLH